MNRSPPDIVIDISIEHDGWSCLGDIPLLAERCVASLLAELNDAPPLAEVSLVLCDDAFIRSLNKTWRGKDEATNVLSFPAVTPAGGRDAGPVLLGDIVVAFETSAGEATAEGSSLRDHLAHLIVHGLSHLLGFDHETDEQAAAMEGLEGRALRALGVASPYTVVEDVRAAP